MVSFPSGDAMKSQEKNKNLEVWGVYSRTPKKFFDPVDNENGKSLHFSRTKGNDCEAPKKSFSFFASIWFEPNFVTLS